jgi:hypothetical protein
MLADSSLFRALALALHTCSALGGMCVCVRAYVCVVRALDGAGYMMVSYLISGAALVSDIISPVNALNWTAPLVANPGNPNAWYTSRIHAATARFTADELLLTQAVTMNRHPNGGWAVCPSHRTLDVACAGSPWLE